MGADVTGAGGRPVDLSGAASADLQTSRVPAGAGAPSVDGGTATPASAAATPGLPTATEGVAPTGRDVGPARPDAPAAGPPDIGAARRDDQGTLTPPHSADLQSSRCPPSTEVDTLAGTDAHTVRLDPPGGDEPEPFYREVFLGRAEITALESDVDALIEKGEWDPGDRQGLVDAAKDVSFAKKARDGDFYAPTLLGTLESPMYNAMPEQWFGQGAESRLFEVTTSPETTYYVGATAPQGPAQGYHADLPGGGTQVYIPLDTDRSGWEVRAVARSQEELDALPPGSVAGYDEMGDLLVTPESTHSGDRTVAVHTVAGDDPFDRIDRVDERHFGEGWHGRTVDKFAGSITERVTGPDPADASPASPSEPTPVPGPADMQGPLISDNRDEPLIMQDSAVRSALDGISESETAATVVDGAMLLTRIAVGDKVEGIDVGGDQVGGAVAYLAGRLRAGLGRDDGSGSPLSDDRSGPLIR